MEQSNKQNALAFLRTLVGQPLVYALKSPDTELYDFGFGELVSVMNRYKVQKQIGTYSLHILCRFKVIWQSQTNRVKEYYEDTSSDSFRADAKYFLGKKVRQVALSDKHDLWLDFGDFWIVFATFEDGRESWRFLTSDQTQPHLVASDSQLIF